MSDTKPTIVDSLEIKPHPDIPSPLVFTEIKSLIVVAVRNEANPNNPDVGLQVRFNGDTKKPHGVLMGYSDAECDAMAQAFMDWRTEQKRIEREAKDAMFIAEAADLLVTAKSLGKVSTIVKPCRTECIIVVMGGYDVEHVCKGECRNGNVHENLVHALGEAIYVANAMLSH